VTGDRDPSDSTRSQLQQLDRLLRRVRFTPRNSLGPELAGRIRRGEQPSLRQRALIRRVGLAPLLAGLATVLAAVYLVPAQPITIDRCCYDLDGGGSADDGALIVGERDGRVFRLSVYEDLDSSGTLTPGDIVRYQRAGAPAAAPLLVTGTMKIQHCCQDFDGGGPPDDGILVIATPPNRVHTAAIYQLR
jgi:hypothetical protein